MTTPKPGTEPVLDCFAVEPLASAREPAWQAVADLVGVACRVVARAAIGRISGTPAASAGVRSGADAARPARQRTRVRCLSPALGLPAVPQTRPGMDGANAMALRGYG